VILKSTLILLTACLADRLLRRASAAARHATLVAAFAALAVLPALGTLLPSWRTTLPLRIERVAAAAISSASSAAAIDWASWAQRIWIAGVVLLLARLAIGHLQAFRIVRRGTSSAPITWGFLRAKILLPPDSAEWPEGLRRSVLLHEQAHVDRFDCVWNLLVRVVTCFYWCNPLAWYAARRARLECERACDDRVLAAGERPSEYSSWLLELARSLRPTPEGALAVVGASTLEARVRSILDPRMNRRALGRYGVLAVAVAASCFVIPLAAMQKVYKIGGDVTAPKLIYKVEPQYTEDARDAKIAGSVVLTMEVDEQGATRKIEVKRGLDPGLDKNAIDAVSQWRFEPARRKDEPVAVFATVEVNFKLH
jgi:TonB family protein